MTNWVATQLVIPAKAGIQGFSQTGVGFEANWPR